MMEKTFGMEPEFIDRRSSSNDSHSGERRQFSSNYDDLSLEAQELGQAIDQYKLLNRRRYVNYEELLAVVKTLGYSK